MGSRVAAAGTALLLVGLAEPQDTLAARAIPLVKPSPSWYTPALHAEVLKAGARGVAVPRERLNAECPGAQLPGVSAGGCIVEPFGCTANFIFSGGGTKYVGTARHCVKGMGDKVVMQVDTATLAAVGTVAKLTRGGCPENVFESGPGCAPGNDFALVRLSSAVVRKWGVNPALPIGGPSGVYGGCDPQPVKFWGHGYEAGVAQGKPGAGLATSWRRRGYGFTGVGLGGDSGSGVVLADNRAAGNLTHLIVGDLDYPGSNLAGTRATAMLNLVGDGIRLVNADGSASGGRSGGCSSSAGRSGSDGLGAGPLQAPGAIVDDAVPDVGEAVAATGEAIDDARDTVRDAVDRVDETTGHVEETLDRAQDALGDLSRALD